jgi:hypothetical protein
MDDCIKNEIGEERRCIACREYWPLDAEFFDRTGGGGRGYSLRCLACIKERNWAGPSFMQFSASVFRRQHGNPQ